VPCPRTLQANLPAYLYTIPFLYWTSSREVGIFKTFGSDSAKKSNPDLPTTRRTLKPHDIHTRLSCPFSKFLVGSLIFSELIYCLFEIRGNGDCHEIIYPNDEAIYPRTKQTHPAPTLRHLTVVRSSLLKWRDNFQMGPTIWSPHHHHANSHCIFAWTITTKQSFTWSSSAGAEKTYQIVDEIANYCYKIDRNRS